MDTYTTKRFTSIKKKEERYFNEEYYRKVDKKIELIKKNKKKNKENKESKNINNVNNNIVNFKDIIKNNIEAIKNEKEHIDCVNGYIIDYSNRSISYSDNINDNINDNISNNTNGNRNNSSNAVNNISFKDYLENLITNNKDSNKNKTILGRLRIKKKIIERNKYKNIDGFAIHIANKSETCFIESINSLIRNYLARFNRKTKRYSKSQEMTEWSLWLLFDKLYWHILFKDNE